jgi:hypothetical protein
VIIPMIAAAWLPPKLPHVLQQLLPCVWGVGTILVAERRFFAETLTAALRAVGFASVRTLVLRSP